MKTEPVSLSINYFSDKVSVSGHEVFLCKWPLHRYNCKL